MFWYPKRNFPHGLHATQRSRYAGKPRKPMLCGFALGIATCPVYWTHLTKGPAYIRAASLSNILARGCVVLCGALCVCGDPIAPPRTKCRQNAIQTRPNRRVRTAPLYIQLSFGMEASLNSYSRSNTLGTAGSGSSFLLPVA